MSEKKETKNDEPGKRSFGGRGGIQRSSRSRGRGAGGVGARGWGSMGRPNYANLKDSRIHPKQEINGSTESTLNPSLKKKEKLNAPTLQNRFNKSLQDQILSENKKNETETPYVSFSGDKLSTRTRFSHLISIYYPRASLYVIQCCANEAEGLTAKETEELFENKFWPMKNLIADERSKLVTDLTVQLQQEEKKKRNSFIFFPFFVMFTLKRFDYK